MTMKDIERVHEMAGKGCVLYDRDGKKFEDQDSSHDNIKQR